MIELLEKYQKKLSVQGLTCPNTATLGGVDARDVWIGPETHIDLFKKVIAGLNINSLLHAHPAEPYHSILQTLINKAENRRIVPQDCETRTFMHAIPISPDFQADSLIHALKKHKAVILPDASILSFGIVSPEQAFIHYSSVCFACFVKLFADALASVQLKDDITTSESELLKKSIETYKSVPNTFARRPTVLAPFADDAQIVKAMKEAGRLTVASRLVDSFFGNLSYKTDEALFITQTGSSLDELGGTIDKCPLDESTSTAITASSEYIAHKNALARNNHRCILHGHPRFAVILSMSCEDFHCQHRGRCHTHCATPRFFQDTPIVCGEVGSGPTGLCNTLPDALSGKGAIVWGHGLFTSGKKDFSDAFENMLAIELGCVEEYERLVLK